jgi:hypothetical protein
MINQTLIATGVLASVVSGYIGWTMRGDHEDAKRLAEVHAIQQEVQRRQDAVDQLALELEAARAAQKPKDRIITKEVVRYETIVPDADRCDLPGPWRVLHDAAATGQPPQPPSLTDGKAEPVTDAAAIQTVAENYEQCRAWRDQVIGWQAFWKSLKRE